MGTQIQPHEFYIAHYPNTLIINLALVLMSLTKPGLVSVVRARQGPTLRITSFPAAIFPETGFRLCPRFPVEATSDDLSRERPVSALANKSHVQCETACAMRDSMCPKCHAHAIIPMNFSFVDLDDPLPRRNDLKPSLLAPSLPAPPL